jgi:hypothetical protein
LLLRGNASLRLWLADTKKARHSEPCRDRSGVEKTTLEKIGIFDQPDAL